MWSLHKFLEISISLCHIVNVATYSSGRFPQSCGSMLPQHTDKNTGMLEKPQHGTAPFTITYSPPKFGEPITVKLQSLSSRSFRGFLLEARESENGPAVGKFTLLDTSMTRNLDCNGIQDSAVSQSNRSPKQSIRANWTGHGTGLSIYFRATFLENFKIFWEPMTVLISLPTPAPSTAPVITSSAPLTTVTNPPTSTSPISSATVTNPPTSTSTISSTTVTNPPTSTSPISSATVTNPPASTSPISSATVTNPPASTSPISSATVTNPPASTSPTSSATVTNPPTSSPISSATVTNPPASTSPTSSATVTNPPLPSRNIYLELGLAVLIGNIPHYPLSRIFKTLWQILSLAVETGALILICIRDPCKTLIALVCVVMFLSLVEIYISLLRIGPSHELRGVRDCAVKVVSFILEIFTFAAIFVGLSEMKDYMLGDITSWPLKVMVGYTAWRLLFLILFHTSCIYSVTLLKRSKIGSLEMDNQWKNWKVKLAAIVKMNIIIFYLVNISFALAIIVGMFLCQ